VRKKSLKTRKECLNILFCFKIFTTNTLIASVYKMFSCNKNQVPYYNVQNFKKWNFWEFGPLIEHGPHWIDFIIITFISEKNRYFRCPYKIWSKFITFDMKKKGNLRCQRFYKKKGEFGGPRSESFYFKWVPRLYLDPFVMFFQCFMYISSYSPQN